MICELILLKEQVPKMIRIRHTFSTQVSSSPLHDRLADQVVKASACDVIFAGSHTSDLKIGAPVATLPDAWCYIGSALGLVGPVSVYCDWVK